MLDCKKIDYDSGILKVDHKGIIKYANTVSSNFFQDVKKLVGKQISEVIPDFIFPDKVNEPYCQMLNIDAKEIFVTSVLLGKDNESCRIIIMLYELEKISDKLKNNVFSNQIDRQMDFLIQVMDNDVSITDGKGIFLRTGNSYCQNYGVKKEEIIGKSVFELEEKGIFSPSVTAKVLKDKKKVTILQKNKLGRNLLTTGVPVFNKNNAIEYVVSFESIDIAGLGSMEEKYKELQSLMQRYDAEIKKLRLKEIQFPGIISKSKKMENIFKLVRNVADTDANILITGETGVGKSLIAKLMHQKSMRSSEPFIEINCGAIPESLIESELFGYEKGSFTGANRNGKIGQVELAQGGTLFLDEIGELPLNMQTKLLHVIQEKKIRRVGGHQSIEVDFRLIAATNKDLKMLVNQRLFREDLFYRLNVVPVYIPPLRERTEDILLLIMHFLSETNKKYNRNKTLSELVKSALLKYNWPGNIRELENVIERLVLITEENNIDIHNLPDNIGSIQLVNAETRLTLKANLELYEKQLIQSAYRQYKTTIEMAKALGISQPSVVRKLKKYIPNYSKPNKVG